MDDLDSRKPLRLWPGVVAAVIVVLSRFVVANLVPTGFAIGLLIALAGALTIIVWWLFFSRARWLDRISALVVVAIAYFAVWPLLHQSIQGGMMGMMFAVYALPPIVAPALVAWAVATRTLSNGPRRVAMVAT